MVFLWFSYGFPMVFPLKPPFSYGLNNQRVLPKGLQIFQISGTAQLISTHSHHPTDPISGLGLVEAEAATMEKLEGPVGPATKLWRNA